MNINDVASSPEWERSTVASIPAHFTALRPPDIISLATLRQPLRKLSTQTKRTTTSSGSHNRWFHRRRTCPRVLWDSDPDLLMRVLQETFRTGAGRDASTRVRTY